MWILQNIFQVYDELGTYFLFIENSYIEWNIDETEFRFVSIN